MAKHCEVLIVAPTVHSTAPFGIEAGTVVETAGRRTSLPPQDAPCLNQACVSRGLYHSTTCWVSLAPRAGTVMAG